VTSDKTPEVKTNSFSPTMINDVPAKVLAITATELFQNEKQIFALDAEWQ
tara:strand:- start:295 stop:444 length:150 start_codon:yes stop_codon:yes gene_type:complete